MRKTSTPPETRRCDVRRTPIVASVSCLDKPSVQRALFCTGSSGTRLVTPLQTPTTPVAAPSLGLAHRRGVSHASSFRLLNTNGFAAELHPFFACNRCRTPSSTASTTGIARVSSHGTHNLLDQLIAPLHLFRSRECLLAELTS